MATDVFAPKNCLELPFRVGGIRPQWRIRRKIVDVDELRSTLGRPRVPSRAAILFTKCFARLLFWPQISTCWPKIARPVDFSRVRVEDQSGRSSIRRDGPRLILMQD